MDPTRLKRELTLPPGVHEIRFSTNASPYAVPPQSEHPLYVRVINLKVTDLGPSPGGRSGAGRGRGGKG
ncbi:MAG: hypothetical protein U0835_24915 [Isosphaeraceae bacterium]